MQWLQKEDKGYVLGHSRDEAFGDSDRGLAYFAERGCTRVDGNGLLSSDEVPMNTHYPYFLRHGFVLREGGAKVTFNPATPSPLADGSQQGTMRLVKDAW